MRDEGRSITTSMMSTTTYSTSNSGIHFSTIIDYVCWELNNCSPASLLELLFLVNNNHSE